MHDSIAVFGFDSIEKLQSGRDWQITLPGSGDHVLLAEHLEEVYGGNGVEPGLHRMVIKSSFSVVEYDPKDPFIGGEGRAHETMRKVEGHS